MSFSCYLKNLLIAWCAILGFSQQHNEDGVICSGHCVAPRSWTWRRFFGDEVGDGDDDGDHNAVADHEGVEDYDHDDKGSTDVLEG